MIPVFNPNLRYLEQTLHSVLSENLSAAQMQIEVIDDASQREDLEACVNKIGKGRIAFYRQPRNLGFIGNWNSCIERSRGHWVHILHQDDLVLPGFYTQLKSATTNSREVGAAFCRHHHIDENNRRIYISDLERETPGILEGWLERIVSMVRLQCASVVVKRGIYEHLGGYCPEARSAADWEMWKRIATHFRFWYEPRPFACFRRHDHSSSSALIKSGSNIADIRQAIEIAELYLPDATAECFSHKAREHYARVAIDTARQLMEAGEATAAIHQIREGLLCDNSPAVLQELQNVFVKKTNS
jgi:glycosyltransferase involved in cell wall biosynthesis